MIINNKHFQVHFSTERPDDVSLYGTPKEEDLPSLQNHQSSFTNIAQECLNLHLLRNQKKLSLKVLTDKGQTLKQRFSLDM